MKVHKNSGSFNKENFLMKILDLKIAIATALLQKESNNVYFHLYINFNTFFQKFCISGIL